MIRAIALIAAFSVTGAAMACTVDPASRTAYPDSVTTFDGPGSAVARAWYDDPVTRYPHFVLGRQNEPETLWISTPGNQGLCGHALTLDADHVFEDTAPRLADLDGDGQAEVVVVRSHRREGAQLAIYRWTGSELVLDAATPYIGRANRWLAPLGIADLDGDGAMEIAYIDRPHLARTLRVWRYADNALTEVAALSGVTNHRIGEAFISGGIRHCGAGPEMVMADARWARIIAVSLEDSALTYRDIAPFSGSSAFAAVLACAEEG
ncbi:MAG: VCBS repeat-containing protein [Pseudomonadota bacterium]